MSSPASSTSGTSAQPSSSPWGASMPSEHYFDRRQADSQQRYRCKQCLCAELWDNVEGTPDLEDREVSLTKQPAASLQHRIDCAAALYSPLYLWQFRLLRLQPCESHDAPVRYDLVLANMIEPIKGMPGVALPESGDVVEYEAISYTWGSSDFSAAIVCNGVDLPVTSNAMEVLSFLRLTNKPRYVWIDSICINQLDIHEKNAQVRSLMFRIFCRAKMALGYLERPPGHAARIVRLLNALNCTWNDITDSVSPYYCRSTEHGKSQRALRAVADSAAELIQICPFFRRAWIRQEVFAAQVANGLRFQSTFYTFTWDLLEYCLALGPKPADQNFLQESTHLHEEFLQAYQCFIDLRDTRKMTVENLERDFGESCWDYKARQISTGRCNIWPTLILQNATGFESSLDVDRMYALCNIAEELGTSQLYGS